MLFIWAASHGAVILIAIWTRWRFLAWHGIELHSTPVQSTRWSSAHSHIMSDKLEKIEVKFDVWCAKAKGFTSGSGLNIGA